jgi:hypothetical protein
LVAQSSSDEYFYACGDATALYNEADSGRTEVRHASRSAMWLKPDHVVVYDRAETSADRRFKRFWLQSATPFVVTENHSVAKTLAGQQLVSTTLLPEGATIVASPDEPDAGDPAIGEVMQHRLMVEAPGAPRRARFLHVIQGADGGAVADAATPVKSRAGASYEGAAFGNTVVVFPVDLGADATTTSVAVPPGARRIFVTGLAKNTGYRVQTEGWGVTVTAGGDVQTDDGGVLAVKI